MEYLSVLLWILISPHYAILFHETSHIITALLLRWSVGNVRIGGSPFLRFGGVRLGLRPFRGSIQVLPPHIHDFADVTPGIVHRYRTQIAVIAAAGPLVNIVMGIAAWFGGNVVLGAVSIFVACHALFFGGKGSDGAIIKAYIRGKPPIDVD